METALTKDCFLSSIIGTSTLQPLVNHQTVELKHKASFLISLFASGDILDRQTGIGAARIEGYLA